MTRIAWPFALATAALACSLPAQATGLTRTFVSSAGNDSNPCTVTQPCATFAHAYSATAANGIVAALDPGKYGPLTITGPITIDGNGWAAITAPSGTGTAGVLVMAGSSDNVVLRGLTIDGAGAANSNGITSKGVGSLVVEDCVVRNTTTGGLTLLSSGTTAQTLAVSNSSFIANGGGSVGIGIITESSGTVAASIDRVELRDSFIGLLVTPNAMGTGAINVAVTDSVAANNFSAGFEVLSQSITSSVSNLTLTHCLAVGSGTGVEAGGINATLWLARSTITGNTTNGFDAAQSGVIKSFGDNYFADNAANSGSLTPVSTQ